ncbi:MAG: NACHT domain-containing protein [Planctomycetota bacterium]|nr:MAG: NACHT domain-containing protein [Planctomycetota bacterium]
MKPLFSFLHLSDLHVGHPSPRHGLDFEIVRNQLLEDVKRWGAEGRPKPEAIFFTGDLVFSGDEEDYKRAGLFLEKLQDAFDLPPQAVYAVAGNHDGVRGSFKTDKALYRILNSVRRGEESFEEAFQDKSDRELLEARFAAYVDFWSRRGGFPYPAAGAWERIFTSKEGLHLRLVGLHTSLLIHEDGDEGHLVLDKAQLAKLSAGHQADLCFSLSHHPLNRGWLQEEEKVQALVAQHTDLHLHGHVHQAGFVDEAPAGGDRRLWLSAGAMHEDERPEEQKYEHGYSVGVIVADEQQQLHLQLWPRRWDDENQKFKRDGVLLQDEEEESTNRPLDKTWKPGSSKSVSRQVATPASELEPWEKAYLEARIHNWQKGRSGLNRAFSRHGGSLGQNQLYVPLYADPASLWKDEHGKIHLAGTETEQAFERGERPQASKKAKRVHLEAALCLPELPCLALQGDPGAGKSVLLEHVASVLAAHHLGLEEGLSDQHHQMDLAALKGQGPLQKVPILLEASQLAATQENKDVEVQPCLDFLLNHFREASAASLELEGLERNFQGGRYLLLVDSLDEVPEEEGRERVLSLLLVLRRRWPKCRMILTTRPAAYLGDVNIQRPFHLLHFGRLGGEEVQAMSKRWAEALAYDESKRADLRKAIVGVATTSREAELTANPLLLNSIFQVFDQDEELPDNLAELYKRMVEVLCKSRKGSQGRDANQKRQLLQTLFLAMQEQGGVVHELCSLAGKLKQKRPEEFPTLRDAEAAIDELYCQTGLLRLQSRKEGGRKIHEVRPWHRSFQEYLAACHLARPGKSVQEIVKSLFEGKESGSPILSPSWKGVIRFLPGIFGQQDFDLSGKYLDALKEQGLQEDAIPKDRRGHIWGLLASALSEYFKYLKHHLLQRELPRPLAKEYEAQGATWPLHDRVFALNGLGRLGDPRLEIEDPWVHVPAGEYPVGDSDIDEEERQVRLNEFWILWRPVTEFDFWTFRKSTNPELPKPKARLNRPITLVDWQQAKDFCRWATETRYWPLPEDWVVDLPHEWEWEAAARGKDRRRYPWGHEKLNAGEHAQANCRRAELEKLETTPIGTFPTGNRKIFGQDLSLVDFSGNVWEWCCNWSDSDKIWRIIRGGSWFSDNPGDLRCAFRYRSRPRGGHGGLGFRVVCRPIAHTPNLMEY